MIEHDQSVSESLQINKQAPVFQTDSKEEQQEKYQNQNEIPSVIGLQESENDVFAVIHGSRYSALEKAELLRDRRYLVGGKRKSGSRKPSPEMQAILEQLEGLQSFFDSVSFVKDDADMLQSCCAMLLDRLRHVSDKCDTYLVKKNPSSAEGKARYRLINEIGERISRDIISLEDKTKTFLALPAEERDRVRTWDEFMNWERTQVFRDNVDGVSLKSTGGNTSDVLIIEKGDKKLFFKKEEKLRQPHLELLMNDKIDTYAAKTNGALKKGSVDYHCMRFMQLFRRETCSSLASAGIVVRNFFGLKSSGDAFADLKKFCSNDRLFLSGETMDLLRSIEGISNPKHRAAVKKAIGDIFTEIKKDSVLAKIGNDTARISPGENMAKRNVATSRLAKLLGIGGIVPESEMAAVEVNGKKKYGVVMQEAPGMPVSLLYTGEMSDEYKGEYLTYSPDAIRDLLNMQIFDALCGQTDRHEGNRMMTLEKGAQQAKDGKDIYEIKTVTGIDSDLSFGKISYSAFMNKNIAGIKQVENKNGLSTPAMSRELAESILALTPSMLEYEMMGILSKAERAALTDRLTGIQEAIRRQMDYEAAHPEIPTKFIEKDQWPTFQRQLLEEIRKGGAGAKKNLMARSYISPSILLGIKVS